MKVCLQCAYNFERFGYKKSRKLFTYRTLTFGCPDGLEPSTFRTTSTFTNCLTTRLYIVVSEDCENPFCGDFAAIFHMNSITLDRTFFTNSLFFISVFCFLSSLIQGISEGFFKLSFAAFLQLQQ